MLRFCDENSAASLASHLFSVSVSPVEHVVKAEQLFPEEKNEALIKNIELFAFPNPTAIESKTFFSFAIGDTGCDFDIGFIYYRNSYSAFCVVTRYYYPKLFRRVLSMENGDMVLNEVRKLAGNEVRKEVYVGNEVFSLDGSREKQELMKLIFDSFTGFDITKITIAMLQARHIFVVASSAERCSTLCAALPLLLEPFRWDLNIIPVLPLKLKDASQIPVPTMIGITNAEVLLEGRVDSNVIVNFDAKYVIDNPLLDGSSPNYQKIVQLQMYYHSVIQNYKNFWKLSPGFPHLVFSGIMKKFILSYLFVYVGNVKTFNEFVQKAKKLPEYLESSQVMHDLINIEEAPKIVSEKICGWFDKIVNNKKSEITAYKENSVKEKTEEISMPIIIEHEPIKKNEENRNQLLDDLYGVEQSSPLQTRQDDLLSFLEMPVKTKQIPNRSNSQQYIINDDLLTMTPNSSNNDDDLIILFDSPQSTQNSLSNVKSNDFIQLLSEDDFATYNSNVSSANQQTQTQNDIFNLFTPPQNQSEDTQTNQFIF